MKRIIFLTALITGFLCGVGGCGTPQKIAYQTLAAVGATVDQAMKVAAALRNDGKMSAAQWQKVDDTHKKFRVSYNSACAIAGFDFSKFATGDVIMLQDELLNIIRVFSAQ